MVDVSNSGRGPSISRFARYLDGNALAAPQAKAEGGRSETFRYIATSATLAGGEGDKAAVVAVGTPVTGRPPHRSGHEVLRSSGSYLGYMTQRR